MLYVGEEILSPQLNMFVVAACSFHLFEFFWWKLWWNIEGLFDTYLGGFETVNCPLFCDVCSVPVVIFCLVRSVVIKSVYIHVHQTT